MITRYLLDTSAAAGHRAIGVIELLTGVLAAQQGMPIVHNDALLNIAAEALMFEHRWVLPRGCV